MPKVLIVNGNRQYDNMFLERGWEITDTMNDADLVQFCGGADVTPKLYDKPKHPSTHSDEMRDMHEGKIFERAYLRGLPMAGICRGGQFLNVMCGGQMYQDVDGHGLHGTHLALDLEYGDVYEVTSTHHQMMIPHPSTGEVVAVAHDKPLSTYRELTDEFGEIVRCEVDEYSHADYEVLFYRDNRCLCFQPHPEFSNMNCREYYFTLLKRKLKL